ncbi:MAG: hypothetical protein L3J57_14820 [Desulfuromusa sp.]|nr:hypothetical protein [Desulfuromusa sp.]
MSSVENRRLAQVIIDQLFIDIRFELFSAKSLAVDEAKKNPRQAYYLGQYEMTKRVLDILEVQAENHYLRIPPNQAELKLVVNNTK